MDAGAPKEKLGVVVVVVVCGIAKPKAGVTEGVAAIVLAELTIVVDTAVAEVDPNWKAGGAEVTGRVLAGAPKEKLGAVVRIPL